MAPKTPNEIPCGILSGETGEKSFETRDFLTAGGVLSAAAAMCATWRASTDSTPPATADKGRAERRGDDVRPGLRGDPGGDLGQVHGEEPVTRSAPRLVPSAGGDVRDMALVHRLDAPGHGRCAPDPPVSSPAGAERRRRAARPGARPSTRRPRPRSMCARAFEAIRAAISARSTAKSRSLGQLPGWCRAPAASCATWRSSTDSTPPATDDKGRAERRGGDMRPGLRGGPSRRPVRRARPGPR